MRTKFIIVIISSLFIMTNTDAGKDSRLMLDQYSKFYARLTDRNQSSEILKLHTENPNVKLFQAGDKLKIYIASRLDESPCVAYVRDTEGRYLVVSLKNVKQCWDQYGGIRRGAMLKIESNMLKKRIVDASVFREVLIKRKNDYVKQLREVNNFLLNFKQYKISEIAKIEQAIISLEEKKLTKLSALSSKRKDYIHLQREINFRLDKLDEDIENYRLERVELLRDRWARDHDLGKPVNNRPQDVKNWPEDDNRFEF